MEVMNIETVEMIASSLKMMGEDDDFDTSNGDNLAGDRRGTWGNLWN